MVLDLLIHAFKTLVRVEIIYLLFSLLLLLFFSVYDLGDTNYLYECRMSQ
jgi:hypothetical protein